MLKNSSSRSTFKHFQKLMDTGKKGHFFYKSEYCISNIYRGRHVGGLAGQARGAPMGVHGKEKHHFNMMKAANPSQNSLSWIKFIKILVGIKSKTIFLGGFGRKLGENHDVLGKGCAKARKQGTWEACFARELCHRPDSVKHVQRRACQAYACGRKLVIIVLGMGTPWHCLGQALGRPWHCLVHWNHGAHLFLFNCWHPREAC